MRTASAERERAEALAQRVTVGIVTALPKEHVAVKAMLEGPVDHDDYVLGEMPAKGGGTHVVALLRTGMGTTLAAAKTARLLGKIETIDAILMVGIAGGVPNAASAWDHVRLGDIVVSDHRGVIDHGHVSETRRDGKVVTEHRNLPRAPSPRLLDAVDDLIGGEHEGKRPWLDLIGLGDHLENSARPAAETDVLLGGELHPADDERRPGEPRIFHGPIASSSVLLKDPQKRDELLVRFRVRAVEMEGAGIADAAWDRAVGYLVVRGICDYCDEIKGDLWQEYAAIIAAAYARAVLGRMRSRDPGPPVRKIESEPPKSAPRTPHNLTAWNVDFRGRRDQLAALDETLRNEARTTITHASVFGLGGIGKSALALEYAHRAVERGEYPGGVWWVHAEGKPVDALVNLAPVLRRHATAEVQQRLAGEETRADVIADAVRVALKAQRARSLLVLDNVSEPGWGPRLPAGEVRVLVTTRDEALAQGLSRRLEVLPPAQAREVADAIAGSARGAAEASAQRRVLEKDLGGLAVAVAMAARAVTTWFSGSWIRYERVLREEMDGVLMDPKLVGEYGRGVFAAIDLSIDNCGPEALALLEGAAMFAPDAVPLAWALEASGLASEGAESWAIATAKELGVVTVDEEAGTVSLHRLVHRQVRSRAERAERGDEWHEVGRRGVAAAAQWINGAVELRQTRAEMEAVDARREHLDAALEAADRVHSQLAWIDIADRLAAHLRNRARSDVALPLLQQALARAEQLTPPDLTRVATILSNLAVMLSELGDAAGAKPLLERAIGINEETFGPEDPSVATGLSNLASALSDLGDAAGAKPLLERALAIDEMTFGPEHPNVATKLSNLAHVLRDLGDAAGAKPLLERALGICEETFGPEHPSVATGLSNLATVLRELGDAAGAKPLLERALGIDEATFGREHPNVASQLSYLAAALYDLGDAAGAKPLLERALAIVEACLPPHHPRARRYRKSLAIITRNLLAHPKRP